MQCAFVSSARGNGAQMTHHGIAPAIDSLSNLELLDPVADQLDAASRAAQGVPVVGNLLRGTWMGSPQHPGIVWIPSGLSLGAGLLAMRADTHHAARGLVVAALAATPSAIATGLSEASSIRKRGRRIAVVHATLNTVGTGLQVMSVIRHQDGYISRPWLYAGLATQMLAAMWGRHLAYNYRAELVAPLEPVIDVRDDHERQNDHERPRDKGKVPRVPAP
jgi:hypothetical protein